jgi:DNA-binding NarL/FixJ family response regulator
MTSLQLPPALFDPVRSFWDRFQKNERKSSEHEEFLASIDESARPTRAHASAQKTTHGRWRILVFLQPEQQQPCQTKRLIDLGLTKREAETVELVVAGLKNTEIAAKLAISINTVQCHLHTIFHKLGIRNRAELIGKVTMPMSIGISSMTQ